MLHILNIKHIQLHTQQTQLPTYKHLHTLTQPFTHLHKLPQTYIHLQMLTHS